MPEVVAVAISGGRDSTALLHAVLRACRGSAVQVQALHVHHGLMSEADDWVRHLERQCRRWRSRIHPLLSLQVERLTDRPVAGESVEAWARQQRYAVLARMARQVGAAHVLLAHHRTDQAETVLLQALRGGGAAGLSAMPGVMQRDGLHWHRPWLSWPASAVAAYAARFRLSCIEDPSNADPRFDRNRLRHQVMPVLRQGFPKCERSLQQVAAHAQAAQALIAEIASLDASKLQDGSGRLLRSAWLRLSPARQRFALQHWLQQFEPLSGLPESLLSRLLHELPGARNGSQWPLGDGWTLGLHRDGLARLQLAPVRAQLEASCVQLSVRGPGRYPVPAWGGALEVERSQQGGVADRWLADIRLRSRQGGEQFQTAPDRPARSLKKQFQAAGVAAWARHAPLIYGVVASGTAESSSECLLLVPGLGLDARALAAAGEPQWALRWIADQDAESGT